MKRLFYVSLAIVFLLATLSIYIASNQLAPLSWRWWGSINKTQGVAIAGYDTVAYHQSNEAVPGDSDFSYYWKDAHWHFSSAENRMRFVQNPDRYAPQYGGYCASGVAYGVTARATPEAWHLESGKLYLFGSEAVKQQWIDKIPQGVIHQANTNWQDEDTHK